jgi:hypothetical protein
MRRYLLMLCAALACNAAADGCILAYHSDIRIPQDCGLDVTETMRVRAEGKQICRRGRQDSAAYAA